MNKEAIKLLNNDSDLFFLYYLEEYKKNKSSGENADKILIIADLLVPYIISALISYLVVKAFNATDLDNLMWLLPAMCIGFLANFLMVISGYEGVLYRKFSKEFKIDKELQNSIYRGSLRNIFYGSSKNLADALNSKYFNIKDDIKKYGGVRWKTVKDIVDTSALK